MVIASGTSSVDIRLIEELSARISISAPAYPVHPISIPPCVVFIVIASVEFSVDYWHWY